MNLEEEQHYRAGAYAMLGGLLRSEPDAELLARVAQLTAAGTGDPLAEALSGLGRAASEATPEAIKHEYFALFIGIGRGELVPYGSWYQSGFLMEKPLGDLRADLARLGFEREADRNEPEDHVGALCEVMSMLVADSAAFEQQQAFFRQHISPWFQRFFADLQSAASASFYREVARFGASFTDFETQYFSMAS